MEDINKPQEEKEDQLLKINERLAELGGIISKSTGEEKDAHSTEFAELLQEKKRLESSPDEPAKEEGQKFIRLDGSDPDEIDKELDEPISPLEPPTFGVPESEENTQENLNEEVNNNENLEKPESLEGAETSETEEAKVEFDSEIEGFSEMGFTPEALESIPGFKELSSGKKRFVLNNFRQIYIGKLEQESYGEYADLLGKSKGLRKAWLSITKEFQKEKIKKGVLEKNSALIAEDSKGALEYLIQSVSEKEDGIEFGEDGNPLFSSFFENLRDVKEGPVEIFKKKFNESAIEFSSIPYETLINPKGKKQKAYIRGVEDSYSQALQDLINASKDTDGVEQLSIEELNKVSEHIRLQQFFTSYPDAEDYIQNIENKKLWKSALETMATQQTAFVLAGGVVRFISTSLTAGLATPAVSATIGWWRSKSRTSQEFAEKDKRMRSGIEEGVSIEKTDKSFVKASSLIERLDDRIKAHESANSDYFKVLHDPSKIEKGKSIEDYAEKIDKRKEELQRRVEYTRFKIEKGLVSFGVGSGNNDLYEKSQILQRLGQASIITAKTLGGGSQLDYEVFLEEENYKTKEEPDTVESRLARNLVRKKNEVEKFRSKYARKRAMQAAGISAGFSVAGWLASDFFADLFNGPSNSADGLVEKNISESVIPETDTPPTEPISVHETGDYFTDPEDGSVENEVVLPKEEQAETEMLSNKVEITIDEDGEGMIHAIADYFKDQGVEHAKAMEIGNSMYLKGLKEHVSIMSELKTLGVDIEKVIDAESVLSKSDLNPEDWIEKMSSTLKESGLSEDKAGEYSKSLYEHGAMWNLVHKGDTFSLDVDSSLLSNLQESSVEDIVNATDYDSGTFEGKSPDYDLPSETKTADVAEAQDSKGLDSASAIGENTSSVDVYSEGEFRDVSTKDIEKYLDIGNLDKESPLNVYMLKEIQGMEGGNLGEYERYFVSHRAKYPALSPFGFKGAFDSLTARFVDGVDMPPFLKGLPEMKEEERDMIRLIVDRDVNRPGVSDKGVTRESLSYLSEYLRRLNNKNIAL